VSANVTAPRSVDATMTTATMGSPCQRASFASFFGLSVSTSASKTSLMPYRKTFAGSRKYAKRGIVVSVNRSAVVPAPYATPTTTGPARYSQKRGRDSVSR
jgi:hypothetical protein